MSKDNKDGIFKNIIGVIVSPKETLERVNENPRIWGYLIPITLIQLIITAVGLPKLISFAILTAQEAPSFSQSLIPMMKTITIVSVLIATLLTPALVALISTVFIKIVTVISKETGNFKNLYCMNILAYVPMLIAAVLTGVIMLFTETQNIKDISTSLTLILSSSTDVKSTIYKLCSCINFFYIWSAILSAIGTSIVFKMRMKKAAIIVFAIYIVGVVVTVLV
jgi:hypothetical protein